MRGGDMMSGLKGTVQSIERAFKILECYTMEKSEYDLADIARMTNLSKSTTHRILSTLIHCGYMKQDPSTQKYGLEIKFFHLGSIVMSNINLRNTANPYLHKLCEETAETINLNIVSGNERLCIDIVESSEVIRNITVIGERNHLCLGASGRVMLACLPDNEQTQTIDHAERKGVLPKERSQFVSDLQIIKEQGYSVSIESRVKGTFSVAAPLFDHNKQLAGSITAAGPIQRLTDGRIEFLLERVLHCASRISEAIGYRY